MKVNVNTITSKQWAKIQAEAEAAIASIPKAHNRQRAHVYSDAIAKGISKFRKVREVEPVGKRAIWDHEYNIGSSRRYSDYVRAYDEVIIERQSSKGDRFIHTFTKGWTDNVVIIWR